MGKTTSLAFRFPNGIQMNDGLNWKRSDFETTVTSTSSPKSCFTLRAAVSPAKFPPSTSTFGAMRNPLRSSWRPRHTDVAPVSRAPLV